MKKINFLNYWRSIALLFFPFLTITQCSDEYPLLDTAQTITTASISSIDVTSETDCAACTYVVPARTHVIDGEVLGLLPGSVIGLSASINYGHLVFRNIVGTPENPIIIKNCSGTAIINGTGLSFSIKTEYSKHFQITGGNTAKAYGIQIIGGSLGITLDKLSTNFEIDHVEIQQVGFAGIMAKTDPSCDDATIRGNFIMKNVYFHDNYIHETGGEGFYVGNSFYENGMNTSCGVRLPHEIHYLKINNNIIRNSGWDGIQVGCATKGARVFANTVENYGAANVYNQRNGIQIGEGTGGLCYGNMIKGGLGNGLLVMGLGDNYVYNNLIVDAGGFGIFCDERVSPGPGFKFINNTILNPKSDGIRIYADLVPMNVIVNNIIVNPGSYSNYTYPRSHEDAFVYKLSKYVNVEMSNNYFSTSADNLRMAEPGTLNFRLTSDSPVINIGADISQYNILTDFYKKDRLKGNGYDIGAVEY